ncbi:hypothetical protein [Pontibacillus salipaludis]|uniref:hypothetical protein n=1 Tax=Pontibacillus salipaludis TaxID=1697394 RepID=UPI0031E5C47C
MSTYTTDIFKYIEKLPSRSSSKLPEVLQFTNPSAEAILFRLLMGTIDLHHIHEGVDIKQRKNYSMFGSVTSNHRLSYRTFEDCPITLQDDPESIDKYFKKNRSNNKLFENVLSEISYYFYYKNKNSYSSGFIHLYRCLEYLSFSFPMIYASKSHEYIGTFKKLQSFFKGDISELKFFKRFLSTLLDSTTQSIYIDVNLRATSHTLIDNYKSIIDDLLQGKDYSYNNYIFSIKCIDYYDFLLKLRNRFFHFLSGSTNNNIPTTKIHVEEFFENINDGALNFISALFFEICKFGIEQES